MWRYAAALAAHALSGTERAQVRDGGKGRQAGIWGWGCPRCRRHGGRGQGRAGAWAGSWRSRSTSQSSHPLPTLPLRIPCPTRPTRRVQVLQRWAEHIHKSEGSLWRAVGVLTSAGCLAEALQLLADEGLPDCAATFVSACRHAGLVVTPQVWSGAGAVLC